MLKFKVCLTGIIRLKKNLAIFTIWFNPNRFIFRCFALQKFESGVVTDL